MDLKNSQFTAGFARILQSNLDPKDAEPRLFRQVKILNSLILIAMFLCVPLGIFWTQVVAAEFAYVYAASFGIWAALWVLLRRTLWVTLVGRLAVLVLFGLCTASVLMLGGTDSNLLAWYLIMPLAAAVCVGKGDLWFWGVVASVTPLLIYLFPDQFVMAASPFSEEVNNQIAGVVLALGALVVSILTSNWIMHHESLARRLDMSVAQLEKEADAHRLLVDTAMLASGETELHGGARRLLAYLAEAEWVSAAAFWDVRKGLEDQEPYYQLPVSAHFPKTTLLEETINTGQNFVPQRDEYKDLHVYHPIRDGLDVVGVIEIDAGELYHSIHQGDWLLQQIAIQLGHIAERERTADLIQREARYDSLTGLYNRRAFQTLLEHELAEAERQSKMLALLFIDLNDFKRVNDSLGHAAGDTVLQVIAKRLQQSVRSRAAGGKDRTRSTDSISRVGGDEFTLVLDNLGSAEEADSAAQRILDSMAAPIQLDGQQFKVGASIGIAIYPEDARRADVLVRSADTAMYAAKRRGRVGFSRYRDSDRAIDSLSFEAQLRHALAVGQLEMHYQLVFECQSSSPVGAEALIRWHHPERGWIPPGQFIPLAEAIGMISEIGKFQFDTVLRWFASVKNQLADDFRIALNLSPAQIEDTQFVEWLVRRLTQADIAQGNIELEITETALLADTAEVQANVRALSDLGVCITLDDFGTGQSSLSLLKRFPIGRLKIDRSFVQGLPNRSADVAIVGAVLSLARSLGIPVVAEGVEQIAQRQYLVEHGCDEMQGYLLAKPAPSEHLMEKLTAHAAATTSAK